MKISALVGISPLFYCIVLSQYYLYRCIVAAGIYTPKQKAIMIIEPDPPLVYCGNSPASPPTTFHAMATSKDN